MALSYPARRSYWDATHTHVVFRGRDGDRQDGGRGGRHQRWPQNRRKRTSAKRTPGVAKYLHLNTKKPVDGRVTRGDKAVDAYKKNGKLDDAKLATAGLINPEFLKSAKGKAFAKAHKISAK